MQFHFYAMQNGPQTQKCMVCGALHTVTVDAATRRTIITLKQSGVLIARLSAVYGYPEYKPYRTGNYRVWFVGQRQAARVLATWNGETWCNGPILFREGSIDQWQGLGGDMEHTKKMPYDHDAPFPFSRIEFNVDEDGLCD